MPFVGVAFKVLGTTPRSKVLLTGFERGRVPQCFLLGLMGDLTSVPMGDPHESSLVADVLMGVLTGLGDVLIGLVSVLMGLVGVLIGDLLSSDSAREDLRSGELANSEDVPPHFTGVLTDFTGVLTVLAGVLTDFTGVLTDFTGVLTVLASDFTGVLTDFTGVLADFTDVLTVLASDFTGVLTDFTGVQTALAGVLTHLTGVLTSLADLMSPKGSASVSTSGAVMAADMPGISSPAAEDILLQGSSPW